jgi:hypothetical protein
MRKVTGSYLRPMGNSNWHQKRRSSFLSFPAEVPATSGSAGTMSARARTITD